MNEIVHSLNDILEHNKHINVLRVEQISSDTHNTAAIQSIRFCTRRKGLALQCVPYETFKPIDLQWVKSRYTNGQYALAPLDQLFGNDLFRNKLGCKPRQMVSAGWATPKIRKQTWEYRWIPIPSVRDLEYLQKKQKDDVVQSRPPQDVAEGLLIEKGRKKN